MTLLTVLLLLIGMTSTSFVAPEGTGYVAYMDGTRLGWWEAQAEAEQAYNAALPQEDPKLHEVACILANEMAHHWSPQHLRPNGDPWWTVLPEVGLALEPIYGVITVIYGATLAVSIPAWEGSPIHARVLALKVQDYGICFEPYNSVWQVVTRR